MHDIVLAPEVVLPQMPAVIAPKDNDGVIAEFQLIQSFEYPADLSVDIADAGIVAVAHAAMPLIAADLDVTVVIIIVLARAFQSLRCIVRPILIVGYRDTVLIIEVPILLGCIEGKVGF